jgi:hypothetical protein
MLGNHPITPVPLATDLAVARKFYHGKLGFSANEARHQLDIAIEWGRYGELFD